MDEQFLRGPDKCRHFGDLLLGDDCISCWAAPHCTALLDPAQDQLELQSASADQIKSRQAHLSHMKARALLRDRLLDEHPEDSDLNCFHQAGGRAN